MSQLNVERVIGLLATDESLRHQFATDPPAAIREMVARGLDLTPSELGSLTRIDPHELSRFAGGLDPRLQKADLHRGVV